MKANSGSTDTRSKSHDDEPHLDADLEPLQPLSDRDHDLFLDLLVNPPEPNAAFREAAEAYRLRHGSGLENGTE